MKAVEVSKEEVLDFLRLELISEISSISFAIEFFEKNTPKNLTSLKRISQGMRKNTKSGMIMWNGRHTKRHIRTALKN